MSIVINQFEKKSVKRVKANWGIDPSNKLIRRKPRSLLRKILDILLVPKFELIGIYRFAQEYLASAEGIVLSEFIHRDSISRNVSNTIPRIFQLSNDWDINSKRSLKGGYLISQDGQKVEVHPLSPIQRISGPLPTNPWIVGIGSSLIATYLWLLLY